MKGIINSGDYAVVWKSFGITKFNSNEIVAFKRSDPEKEKVVFIKRIVASSGDTLVLLQDGIQINGNYFPHDPVFLTIKSQFENYRVVYLRMLFKQTGTYEPSTFYLPTDSSVIIPDNFYFMIGDNFYESMDSRLWGFIHKSQIIGEVLWIW